MFLRLVHNEASESGAEVRLLEGQSVDAASFLEALPFGIAVVDDMGVIVDLNQPLAEMTGYRIEELVGKDIQILVPLGERSTHPGLVDDLGRPHNGDHRAPRRGNILRVDGHEFLADVTPSRLSVGGTTWRIIEVRDLGSTAVLESSAVVSNGRAGDPVASLAESLAESELRFRLAFQGSMAPMVFSDENGLFLAVNSAFCQMSGRSEEELIGGDSKHFTYPEDIGISEAAYQLIKSGEVDESRYTKRFLHKNGRLVIAEVSICAARDDSGTAQYFVSSVRDVTEERALAAQLSYQALHDPLTGLANRALFDDRLVQARSRASREQRLGAVLLMDLDDFKGVNDSYGHLVGDQLLMEVANRFKGITRVTDTLCRFGGDEFLYLAEGLTSHAEAELIAARLLGVLQEPFTFSDVAIQQRASVGVVVWEGDDPNNIELIQNADAAMYEAKRQGHGHITMFTPEIGREAVSRFALVQELRHALDSGDVKMHYQPIIDLTTDDVVGFEALMRWHHPTRGWIPPDVFIPLAEQSELILDLGAFALSAALAAASTWDVTDPVAGHPYVTVNLSARQFHDPGLIPLIQDELLRHAIQPERLILEVTESVALVDIAETMNIMEELNRLRIGIALDDFGTGYSSLSYLAALNPRIIKIDQSFVRPKHDKKRSDTLLEAIVTLGNKLHMTVLAEGIETIAQLDRLHSLDCELGQGFLWSPAVPIDEATVMLAKPSTD